MSQMVWRFPRVLSVPLPRPVRHRQLQACLKYRRASAERYPHDPWLHFDLFESCRDIEPAEPHEALRHMAAACVLSPTAPCSPPASTCYARLKAHDLAVSAYLKSLSLHPNSGIAYQYMGLALARKKDENEAIAAFKEALRLVRMTLWRSAPSQWDWSRWAGPSRPFGHRRCPPPIPLMGRQPRLWVRYDAAVTP